MANDINRVILIGRLTKDPELKYTQNGSSVANFTIANGRTYTVSGDKKEYTSFFNCIAWSKLGETIAQYCKKGQRVGLEGRLQQRTWDDKDGNKRSAVEVVVDTFQFLDAKKNGDGKEPEVPENPFSSEDIPF